MSVCAEELAPGVGELYGQICVIVTSSALETRHVMITRSALSSYAKRLEVLPAGTLPLLPKLVSGDPVAVNL